MVSYVQHVKRGHLKTSGPGPTLDLMYLQVSYFEAFSVSEYLEHMTQPISV